MSQQVAADRPMHALRAHRRGGPEQLVYEPAPQPPLGIGDVLVRVQAASFTPTELGWPSTWTDRLGRDRTPVTPAYESPMTASSCRRASGPKAPIAPVRRPAPMPPSDHQSCSG